MPNIHPTLSYQRSFANLYACLNSKQSSQANWSVIPANPMTFVHFSRNLRQNVEYLGWLMLIAERHTPGFLNSQGKNNPSPSYEHFWPNWIQSIFKFPGGNFRKGSWSTSSAWFVSTSLGYFGWLFVEKSCKQDCSTQTTNIALQQRTSSMTFGWKGHAASVPGRPQASLLQKSGYRLLLLNQMLPSLGLSC